MARSRRLLTTASGTRLTPEYERRLLREAERGYNSDELVLVTGPGRPSLSGRKGHSHRLDLRVDDATYEAVRELAEERQVAVSEIVREAIARYLHPA